MQLSAALQHRRPPPAFANHTPRRWEITAVCPSQSLPYSDDMFGLGPAAGMTIDGAGPPRADASTTMGQGSSATATAMDRKRSEKLRKATSSAILRQDSIQQTFEDSRCTSPATDYTPALSGSDTWSMHYDCTNQAPDSTACSVPAALNVDRMNTQTSLARLPKENPSHDLAWFLKNTAPPAPHRKPSKANHSRRAVNGKHALRLFRNGGGQQRRPRASLMQSAHDRLNGILRDEGGLLPGIVEIPKNYQQKISSTGKRYLALVPEQPEHDEDGDTTMSYGEPSILSPDILESRVSVRFHDDVTSATDDILNNWLESYADTLDKQQTSSISDQHTIMTDRSSKPPSSFQDVASRLSRQHHYSDTPIRPAASNPPTPIPESAISMAESYQSSVFDRPPPKPSFDTSRALTSHPISPIQENRPHTPGISLPHEAFPAELPSPGKEVQIRHPVPRRFGSHPVLLQRASSIASMMYQRSVSEHRDSCESPGPPPPRSPLRLRRDPWTIEGIISNHESTRKSTPRVAPSIKSASELNLDTEQMRATVTTECSGPIKRPKSRGKKDRSMLPGVAYSSNRREREDRVRARKIREKPSAARMIDSIVHEPESSTPRQRLKKLRPRIQIPALPPHRAASAASRHSDVSSAASYKKITQSTLSPVSPMPSLASEISEEDQMGYTPISPTASAEARVAQASLPMPPKMLVAEAERKSTKSPKSPKSASKLAVKDSKSIARSYKPRPRSASLPRNALRRRSRQSMSNHSSPRNKSPAVGDDAMPPLPSPCPQRALPPTPPQSGSEKPIVSNTGAKRSTTHQSKDVLLSSVPSHEVSPISTASKHKQREREYPPDIITQRKRSGECSSSSNNINNNNNNNIKMNRKTTHNSRAVSRIDARLEALEKQNALLSAALMAVLKTTATATTTATTTTTTTTNGAIDPAVLPELILPEPPKGPMKWETRVARRSEATMASSAGYSASHAASSSNGSALEMYMSTRRGTRRWERVRE